MKLFFKPFGIAAGVLASRIGKETFDAIWKRISDSDAPPSPTEARQSLVTVAGSAALEAAILAAATAAADQLAARAFHQLFGAWPSKPKPDESEAPAVESGAPAA